MVPRLLEIAADASDPFGPDRVPLKGGELREPKTVKQKAKRSDLESRTRDELRRRGYIYGRTEVYAFSGPGEFVKKDLFGIVDGIAIGNGELLLIQTTSRGQKSSHLKKIRQGSFKIGNGSPTPIHQVVREIIAAGIPLVFFLWDQPDGAGTKWRLEEYRITDQDLITPTRSRKKHAY